MEEKSLRVDWIALAVATAAAVFSGLLWLETRSQGHPRFETAMSFDIDTLAGKHRFGIGVRNSGPGVAHVQSVTYYLDGAPIDDVSDTLEEVGLDSDRDTGVDVGPGDFIAPNDVVWLIDYSPRSREEEQRVAELFERRMQVAVEYCDANDVCRRICTKPNGCPMTLPRHDGAASQV
jgi:hypothetical protein